MPEFFNVLPPDEARSLLLQHLTAVLPSETIPTDSALGRVTTAPILSPQPLPAFRRSTMDGYAVRAADTFGASGSLPAFLSIIGEVPMGHPAAVNLKVGEAAIVHTGGMIPQTADAVVQVELTQIVGADAGSEPPFEIEVFKAVASGENVLQVGEDVQDGAEVLPQGHLLRPQDLGGLLALGITTIGVTRRPRVAILATGDEVVAPHQETKAGQIRDINSYTVAGQVRKAGGIPILGGIIADHFEALEKAARNSLTAADMLVMSAGSSVSLRDMTVKVIEQLGKPGVLFHGVATRPGKPTIVGVVGNKPVLGLPGNPVSAMVQFDMFGTPAIYQLQGLNSWPKQGFVWANLSQNIASQSGREDYVPARLEETLDGLIATPVFGKSNLIYTLVNADGLIKIPLNKSGLIAGEQVEVRLF
jgi:molybdopterin molybdotransferase